MAYNVKYYEDLYKDWLANLKGIPNDDLVEQVSSVMRSKLTSIIGSGQVLADELKDLHPEDTEQLELLNAIIESARYISTMLDAAVDTAHNNNQPASHP